MYKEPNIEEWFEHLSSPMMEEGYSEIVDVSTYLQANVNFTTSALIVDLKSLVSVPTDGSKVVLKHENTKEVMMEYLQMNPNGR